HTLAQRPGPGAGPWATNAAARWTCNKYFAASGCIEQHLLTLDARAEVRVREPCRRDEVDAPREQSFQPSLQCKECGCVLRGRPVAQIDQEVHVTRRPAADG